MNCPNCGATNPATNRFCQNCGRPLEAVPVATAVPHPTEAGAADPQARATSTAVVTAPSPVAAAGAPSPPSPPSEAPRSGLPLPALIGSVVGGMLVLSVVGLLVLRGILGSQQPDPNPGPTPGPTAPPPIGGTTIDQQNLAITQPDGWTVASQSASHITLKRTAGGELTVVSGRLQQSATPDVLIQADLAIDQKLDPNAKICKGPFQVAVPKLSSPGTAAVVCYIQTPQDGSSFQAVDYFIEALAADGVTEFEIEFWAPRSLYNAFLDAAVPVASTVTWKLAS